MSDTDREERRTAFIQALRDCADFFEQRPTLAVPSYTVLNVFVNTKEEIAACARLTTWEKVFNENWFSLRKSFDPADRFLLEVNAARETVCRKVVTGTEVLPAREARVVEVVEWICDEPVLAGDK